MAAPNLRTLLDFETNIEDAAKTFLATDTGLAASSVFASLDQDNLVLPRVSVMFELGEALDPVDIKTTGSTELEYRKFTGTLNVIVTSDGSTSGSQTAHRNHRADVRKSMLLNSLNFTTPDASKSIVVSGAPLFEDQITVDGLYVSNFDQNGKPYYIRNGAPSQADAIRYNSGRWEITAEYQLATEILYVTSSSTTATPDLETTWAISSADPPVPTVTAGKLLNFYDIKYMRPAGTTFEMDGDLAVSTLSYDIQFAIRNDAWPS